MNQYKGGFLSVKEIPTRNLMGAKRCAVWWPVMIWQNAPASVSKPLTAAHLHLLYTLFSIWKFMLEHAIEESPEIQRPVLAPQ
jgi:hypothetical protein